MSKRLHVFLSDQAYYGLIVRLAGQLHCPHQISRIVRRLPTDADAWEDTRSPELQGSDEEFQAVDMPTMWSWGIPRYRRGLTATQETIDALVGVAEAFCIQNFQRPTGGMNPHARLSALLEAIGLGFLSLTAYRKEK